jgi:hypothetical protein
MHRVCDGLALIGRWVAVLLSVCFYGTTVTAQTNNFTYELRLVSEQVAPGGQIALPPGGGTIRFWLEARSRANSLGAGNSNFGVLRATTGPAGQLPSRISVVDSVPETRLARGPIGLSGTGANAGTPLTGRGPGFRAGGTTDSTVSPWHSATQNGTGGAAFPSGTGNAMGAFDQNGDRLYGFDAYTGGSRVGESDPWIAAFPPVPIGQFSTWNRMYRVDLVVAPGPTRSIELTYSAYLCSGVRTQDLGGTWLMNITAASPASGSVTGSFSFEVIEAPIDPSQYIDLGVTSWSAIEGGNGRVYQLVQAPRALTWNEARQEAQRRGGDLATVTSEPEHQVVSQRLLSLAGAFANGSRVWLGGVRTSGGAPAEGWSWVSGENWSYTRWASGEPSVPTGVTAVLAYLPASPATGAQWAVGGATVAQGTSQFLVELPACPTPVAITQQPVQPTRVVPAGTLVNLSIGVTGAARVQWLRNGLSLGAAGQGRDLSIISSVANSGVYECQVFDACGGVFVSDSVSVGVCSSAPMLVSSRSDLGERTGHQLEWDSTTESFVAFGGIGFLNSQPQTLALLDDTLRLVGDQWTRVSVSGAVPPPREGHAMAPAPGGGVLLFGGSDVQNTLGDTWLYRNGVWSAVPSVGGVSPPARWRHSMAFDPARNVVVLFGGSSTVQTETILGDTWTFDGTRWTQLNTGGVSPPGRAIGMMGFDANRGGVIVFGGASGNTRLGDTWVLEPGGWRSLSLFGPSARFGASMHWDPVREALVMVGGVTSVGGTDSIWLLDRNGWVSLLGGFVSGAVWGQDAASSPRGQSVLAGGQIAYTWLGTQFRPETWVTPQSVFIGQQPTAQQFFIPGQATAMQLRVGAAGRELRYQWYRDGQLVVDGPQAGGTIVLGATTERLTIERPGRSSAGAYYVEVSGPCTSGVVRSANGLLRVACGLSDVASAGAVVGPDGVLDTNDFVIFIDWFFNADPRADLAGVGAVRPSDGLLDANDLVVFVQEFFEGCL